MVGMTGTDKFDANTIDLIEQLCMRVGMLMEDAATLALHRSGSGPEPKSRLSQLQASVTSMDSLIAAASALARLSWSLKRGVSDAEIERSFKRLKDRFPATRITTRRRFQSGPSTAVSWMGWSVVP